MIPEAVHARHLADLDLIKRYMDGAGMETILVEKNEELPLNTLLAPIEKDDRGRDRVVSFTYLPASEEDLEHISLLQIYSIVPCDFSPENKKNLESLLHTINGRMAVGHFSLKEDDEVYCRYVYAAPKSRLPEREEITETAMLFIYMLDMFGGLISSVAGGEKDLQAALRDLAD